MNRGWIARRDEPEDLSLEAGPRGRGIAPVSPSLELRSASGLAVSGTRRGPRRWLNSPHGTLTHALGQGLRRDASQVAVGRRGSLMAEQSLYLLKREAVAGELGGVGVAKAVCVHAAVDARLACEPGQKRADVA